jgi:hypothetical protein
MVVRRGLRHEIPFQQVVERRRVDLGTREYPPDGRRPEVVEPRGAEPEDDVAAPERVRVPDDRILPSLDPQLGLDHRCGAVLPVRRTGRAAEAEDGASFLIDRDRPPCDGDRSPPDLDGAVGEGGLEARQREGRDRSPVEDPEQPHPPVDPVGIRIVLDVGEGRGPAGDFRNGEQAPGRRDVPAVPSLGQPFVQPTDPRRLPGDGPRPGGDAAGLLAEEQRPDESLAPRDGVPEGDVVRHAVHGRLRVQDVEGDAFRPGALQIPDDGTVDFPGPRP